MRVRRHAQLTAEPVADEAVEPAAAVTLRAMATYPTEKIARMTVAKAKPAGVPMPLPYPTESGVLKSIAEIGAAPVTVRKRTPGARLRRRAACERRRAGDVDALHGDHSLMAGAHAPWFTVHVTSFSERGTGREHYFYSIAAALATAPAHVVERGGLGWNAVAR